MADEFVRRDALILYYIWGSRVKTGRWRDRLSRPRGFAGSISELSRKLGYKDDSSVNRRINRLIEGGYIKERRIGNAGFYGLK